MRRSSFGSAASWRSGTGRRRSPAARGGSAAAPRAPRGWTRWRSGRRRWPSEPRAPVRPPGPCWPAGCAWRQGRRRCLSCRSGPNGLPRGTNGLPRAPCGRSELPQRGLKVRRPTDPRGGQEQIGTGTRALEQEEYVRSTLSAHSLHSLGAKAVEDRKSIRIERRRCRAATGACGQYVAREGIAWSL